MKYVILFSLTGFTSGFINGFFGTGGAIPLLALFAFLVFDTDKAFATANLTVMLLSAVSFIFYIRHGILEREYIPSYFSAVFIPALAGGALGSLILSRVSPNLLKKIFFLLIVAGGVGTVMK